MLASFWARDHYVKMAATEDKLTINEEYAKRYEQKKRAEELSKRETASFAEFLPFPLQRLAAYEGILFKRPSILQWCGGT